MFTKLRNKFLILNLVIISFMMLLAFAAIYFITYNNVQGDISIDLHRTSEFYRNSYKTPVQPNTNFIDTISSQRSLSITMFTDTQWKIETTSSVFDIDTHSSEKLKNAALSQNKSTGTFKISDNVWAFMIESHYNGYQIVFLDITSRQAILTNLVYTFLIIAIIMLVFIFFISKFFANRSIKPVREAFYRQKQFIADASHELKTPLTVINTNVDVLLSNGEENINNYSKWLYYIKSEVERMTKLTNDLLYLTQLDYTDVKMIYTDFDLSEIVEIVILTMEAAIFENNISFEYDIEPNLRILGNKEQIKQVIMILLDNAMKYTNKGGNIKIHLKKSYNIVSLSISNTGEGISSAHIEKIFDRFYRADGARGRKSGDYGLGLSIAKKIIDQHSGKISVRSTVNVSTTFSIELPRINHE